MSATSRQGLLDTRLIDELQQLMGDDFEHLLTTFVTDSQFKLEQLQQALSANDLESVRQLAHSLKGSCRNMGVIEAADGCQAIESRAHQGESDGLVELLTGVGSSLSASIAELQASSQ